MSKGWPPSIVRALASGRFRLGVVALLLLLAGSRQEPRGQPERVHPLQGESATSEASEALVEPAAYLLPNGWSLSPMGA